MAETYKRLGNTQIAINNSAKIVYRTDTGKSAIVSNITIVNTAAVSKVAILSIDMSGQTTLPNGYTQPDTERIYQLSVQPNETIILEPGIVLNQNRTLIVNGGDGVVVSVFGSEIDDTSHYKAFDLVSGTASRFVPVTTGKQHIYRSILLFNRGAIADTIKIAAGSETGFIGTADTFINDILLNPGETVAIKLGIGLSGPASLAFQKSSLDLLNINVFGAELDAY